MEINDLELTFRSESVLNTLGIKTVEQLTKTTVGTLRSQRNVGNKTIQEIRERLLYFGLCLEGDFIVQSAAGIQVVYEIPKLIERIYTQINLIKSDIKDIEQALDRLRLS